MEFASDPIVAFLILLGVLVFGHELGHYLVGKWCGIAVEIFSIGFGPPIFRWQRGETEYRISLLPLGGFVKFYGSLPSEDVPASVRGREFHVASPSRRIATIAAGPIANLVIAAVAYMVVGMHGIPHHRPIVGQLVPNSAAARSSLEPGDLITAINGKPILKWEEMLTVISDSPGQEIELTVDRNGEALKTNIVPDPKELTPYPGAEKKTVGRAGIGLGLVPATYTITSKESPLRDLGVPSTFHIKALQIADREKVEVKFQRDLLKVIEDSSSNLEGGQQVKIWFSEPTAQKDNEEEVKEIETELVFPLVAETFRSQLNVVDAQLTVLDVRDEKLKESLKPGDRIIAFKGQVLEHFFDFGKLLRDNRDEKVAVTLVSKDTFETREETLHLAATETQTPKGKEIVYAFRASFAGQPIAPEPYVEKYDNVFSAAWYGTQETIKMSGFLVATIWNLITGEVPLGALGGPILIAKVASESAKHGIVTFLTTLALISVNLAMINLFPIPVFDGGQICIVATEAIRRKPLSEIAVENFQKVGFVMILVLVFLATYNDVKRFWISKL